ncbi:MAG: prepilin-type N-terminal cleavage/methylation domain-containing protein [Planctomycetota bacterium]|nr:prepilin-type N-terminal cleavage/methylation domain-containing protein [Planctomycetota bacterium]
MSRRTRAFTLVELMVVISIIALLVGILLPAISRARDNAKIGMSKSNIRNIKTAHDMFETDYGVPWTGTPEVLSSGPDGSWTGLPVMNATNNWRARYWKQDGGTFTILPGVLACETDGGGHWFPLNFPCHTVPYCYTEGLTKSSWGFGRVGTFRFTNTRQISEYMDDKCYHKSFWAPKDRILQRALQRCWDEDGTMCSVSLVDGGNASIDLPFLLQPSSYGLCPPNMVNPAVYRLPATDEDPEEAFTDPMSIPTGFRPATLGQARYSSLNTFLMEMHWMQNLTTGECGPRWEDAISGANYHVVQGNNNEDTWSYQGCYPNYFNASWRSAPVACFVDGHVDMIECQEAEKHDYVVADGNDSTGALGGYKGLWHRGVAGDLENGFFVECRTDWGNWSGHTHTAGGLTHGRDVIAE